MRRSHHPQLILRRGQVKRPRVPQRQNLRSHHVPFPKTLIHHHRIHRARARVLPPNRPHEGSIRRRSSAHHAHRHAHRLFPHSRHASVHVVPDPRHDRLSRRRAHARHRARAPSPSVTARPHALARTRPARSSYAHAPARPRSAMTSPTTTTRVGGVDVVIATARRRTRSIDRAARGSGPVVPSRSVAALGRASTPPLVHRPIVTQEYHRSDSFRRFVYFLGRDIFLCPRVS